MLKKPCSTGLVGVKWLNGDFHMLATATPIPKGIRDWEGYMPFIEHKDAAKWWSNVSPKQMKVKKDVNPFDLDDDHPAAKLRLTSKACKDFISPLSVGTVAKGLRLGQIWSETLLRRRNASRVPFENGPMIGASLPAIRASLISCQYTKSERATYNKAQEQLVGHLISPDSKDRKGTGKWSLSIHRKLQLLSMSLMLPKIDEKYDLKAKNLRHLYEDPAFFHPWLRGMNPPLDPQKAEHVALHLHHLCAGAPKLRVRLSYLRDQIS
ncbi:MAG: hypothetical protein LQ338_008138 [Usnochroma carphineum]|nr:MAG: hypothetical protein LQ338_008138 [Usnochroma carphineum]